MTSHSRPYAIPRGETRAALLAEPTRLRVRAESVGQCRPKDARIAGRIDGRVGWRAIIEISIRFDRAELHFEPNNIKIAHTCLVRRY